MYSSFRRKILTYVNYKLKLTYSTRHGSLWATATSPMPWSSNHPASDRMRLVERVYLFAATCTYTHIQQAQFESWMDGCIASCTSIVSIHPSIAQVVLTFVECDEAARRLTVARSLSFEKWSGNLNRMDGEFPLLLFSLLRTGEDVWCACNCWTNGFVEL